MKLSYKEDPSSDGFTGEFYQSSEEGAAPTSDKLSENRGSYFPTHSYVQHNPETKP